MSESVAEISKAMKDGNVSIHFVTTFTHGTGVRVQIGTRKIGPILFPVEGQTLAEILFMLGTMREESVDE